MAVSINWPTKVISIPQSYLTNLGGGGYELDVDELRLDLKDLEDSEEGMAFLSTHNHNTTVTLSGVTYSRTFEVINGYTIEFEDGSYTVSCVGANHNIADVKVVNSVSLLIGNSAGLIQVTSGSGVTEQDKEDIAALVWAEATRTLTGIGASGIAAEASITSLNDLSAAEVWGRAIESGYTAEELLRLLSAVIVGKSSGQPTNAVFRDINDTKDRVTGTVDSNGNRTSVTVDAS